VVTLPDATHCAVLTSAAVNYFHYLRHTIVPKRISSVSPACGNFCRFVWFTPSFPSFSTVFTVWHAYCYVYDPEEQYTTNSILAEPNTMMKLMTLTAAAAFALATGAKAQYYNFDVTVHQALQPPSVGEIIANQQVIHQQNTVQFRNVWVYQLNNAQRGFWVRVIPGLGAALAHNDWSAACSFADDWHAQEDAYEKKYHQVSPAMIAASARFLRTSATRKHK
jgi:hypothetical protein